MSEGNKQPIVIYRRSYWTGQVQKLVNGKWTEMVSKDRFRIMVSRHDVYLTNEPIRGVDELWAERTQHRATLESEA